MTTSMGPSLAGARILVVEDEYLLADDLARALRSVGAEPVGPVSSVEQAENLLAREHLDGAILDLNLRGQMASPFVERVAAAHLPCLIVSGYGEDELPETITHLPRIEKPASPSSVVASLAAELGRAG